MHEGRTPGDVDRSSSLEPSTPESTKGQGIESITPERDNGRDPQTYDLSWMQYAIHGNGYTYLDLFINSISLWRQPLN